MLYNVVPHIRRRMMLSDPAFLRRNFSSLAPPRLDLDIEGESGECQRKASNREDAPNANAGAGAWGLCRAATDC